MSLGKKILIISFVILSVICLGIDGWYLYVMAYAPEKVISQTYEVGIQSVLKADGSTEKEHFIDINLFNNCFEIQFNYMLDENQTAFYSQGLQYVLSEDSDTFDFDGTYNKLVYKSKADIKKQKTDLLNVDYYWHYNNIYSNKEYTNVVKYNYMSGDSYATTTFSSNPIDEDTMFKIQIGDEFYGMKFRYSDIDFKDTFHLVTTTTFENSDVYGIKIDRNFRVDHDYRACDIDYFVELLYEAVQSLSFGTSQTCVFEFGDLFDYFKYDETTQQYSEDKVETDNLAKIIADVKSYYCIGVNVHNGDLVSSTQSLFNCYKGYSNYNLSAGFDDYFIGRTLVNLTVDDFNFIATETSGVYNLELKQEFKEYYTKYKNSIRLDIVIDLDYLRTLNIEFNGLKAGTLDNFEIFSAITTETVDGELIKGALIYE